LKGTNNRCRNEGREKKGVPRVGENLCFKEKIGWESVKKTFSKGTFVDKRVFKRR